MNGTTNQTQSAGSAPREITAAQKLEAIAKVLRALDTAKGNALVTLYAGLIEHAELAMKSVGTEQGA